MRVNMIEFMSRKNKGNYEHDELRMSAVIEEGEDLIECTERLKNIVLNILNNKPVISQAIEGESHEQASNKESNNEESSDNKVSEEKPVKVKKSRNKKPEESKQEVISEDVPPVIVDPIEIPEVVESEKPKRGYVKFDNQDIQHKAKLAKFLNQKHSGWQELDKVKLKELSNSLVGKNFVDKSGEMCKDFIFDVERGLDAIKG